MSIFRNAAPPDEPSHNPVVRRIWRYIEESFDFCEKAHEQATKNWKFMSPTGDQWEHEDRELADKYRIPALNVNDVAPTIQMISGQEVTSRYEPRLRSGPSQDTVAQVEVDNEWLKKVRADADCQYEESDAFHDMLIGAYSWCEYHTDFLGGKPRETCTSIPIWQMVWDKKASRINLLDREYHIRGRWLDLFSVKSLHPEIENAVFERAVGNYSQGDWPDPESKDVSRRPWLYQGKGVPYKKKKDEVWVVRAEWRELSRGYMVTTNGQPEVYIGPLAEGGFEYDVLDDGRKIDVNLEALRHLLELFPEGGVTYYRYNRHAYKHATLMGDVVLESGEMPEKYWTMLAMVGFPYKTREATKRYSPVDMMRDPQRWANRYYSLWIQSLGAAAKNAYMVDENQADVDRVTGLIARPGAVIPVKNQDAVKLLSSPAFSPAINAFEHVRPMTTQRVGVNPYQLSQVTDLKRTSGSAISQVSQASNQILSYPFDSLKRFRVEAALLLLKKKRAYWEVSDVQALVGSEMAQQVLPAELWRDTASTDVVVDETPVSATSKMETLDFMTRTNLLPQMAQLGYPPPPEVLLSMFPTLTSGDKEKWLTSLQQRTTPPDEGGAGAEGSQPPQDVGSNGNAG